MKIRVTVLHDILEAWKHFFFCFCSFNSRRKRISRRRLSNILEKEKEITRRHFFAKKRNPPWWTRARRRRHSSKHARARTRPNKLPVFVLVFVFLFFFDDSFREGRRVKCVGFFFGFSATPRGHSHALQFSAHTHNTYQSCIFSRRHMSKGQDNGGRPLDFI